MTKYQWELLKAYIKEATTPPLLRDFPSMYAIEERLDKLFSQEETNDSNPRT